MNPTAQRRGAQRVQFSGRPCGAPYELDAHPSPFHPCPSDQHPFLPHNLQTRDHNLIQSIFGPKDGVHFTVDTSFKPANFSATNIHPVRVLHDGRILVTGNLSQIPGMPTAGGLLRLHPDGSLDKLIYTNWTDSSRVFAETADAKLIAATRRAEDPPDSNIRLMRIGPEGVIELWGDYLDGAGAELVRVQSDESIIIRSTIAPGMVDLPPLTRIWRITPQLTNDPSFVELDLTPRLKMAAEVNRIMLQPDGKLLVTCDEYVSQGTIRINHDKSIDNSFEVDPNLLVNRIYTVQPDGRVLGSGILYNDDRSYGPSIDLVRLNSDGTRDNGFPMFQFERVGNSRPVVAAVSSQADGSVLAMLGTKDFSKWWEVSPGVFSSSLTTNIQLAALPPEGGPWRNLSGDLPVNVQPGIEFVTVFQSDGSAILVGSLTRIADLPCDGAARIRSDGTLDRDFHPRLGAELGLSAWQAIVGRADQIIVAARKYDRSGIFNQRLIRILRDGKIDDSFIPSLEELPNFVLHAVGDDGSIYGRTIDSGVVKLVRIQANGIVGTVAPIMGVSDIGSLVVERDGAVVTSFYREQPPVVINGGPVQYNIARLKPTPVWRSSGRDTATGRFTGTIGCLPGWKYRVEASADLQQWDTVASGTSAGESVPFTDTAPPGTERRFYRVVRE